MSKKRQDQMQKNLIIDQVDEVAVAMELKHGPGRLPRIVPHDLAAKFTRQAELFNQAIWEGEAEDAVKRGQAMIRAWQALDKVATEAGHKPVDPEVWEFTIEDDQGNTMAAAVCKSDAEAHVEAIKARQAGRKIQVYSLAEIGRVLSANQLIAKVKDTFEGAFIQDVKHQHIKLDDDLPF